jgi:pimeloyl-ACP methyl ester carboxylesterase
MSALTETNPHIKITHDNTTTRLRRSARIVGRALLAIVGALVLLLIAIPVLVAPFITGTPLWLSLLLIGIDVALIVALVRYISSRWVVAGIVAAWIGVSLLAIWFSQVFAYTPPIVDANGNTLPNSIAVLEKVKLNDSEQWISIRGKDKNKPLLLFLAGGPGGSQLVTARRTLAGLEDHFVVVNWEQPGAAKSFDAVPRATLTPERYIEDGRALVLYLRERFGQDKVYVVGESWGSALGILLVQRYPELFHAFIGTGQMVAFTETDVLCYEFALNWARERGDAEKVAQLEAQGPPPYYGAGVAMKQAAYLLDTFAYMNQNPAIPDNGFNTLDDLAAHDYGLYDKVNYVRGVLDTLDVVYPQLWDIDFRKTATKLDVPVYFLLGRHDVNAPPKLTQDYFTRLNAPHKELIWFERSGHTPWTTEPAAFVDAIVNRVLPQASQGAME